MARIIVNVIQHPEPSLIEEDLEIAADGAGIDDFVVTDQYDGTFTVDAYSARDIPIAQVKMFQAGLPNDGKYAIQHFAGFPPPGWVYAEREIKYQ